MIKRKLKTLVICKTCGKRLQVRNDYIKTHTGFCQSCRKKEDWKKLEYAKKCSDSHLGQISGNRSPKGDSNLNNLFYTYQKSAQKRGISFELYKEDFKKLTKQNCYYCGIEPKQKHQDKRRDWNGFWLYNGLDRLDDDKGYILSNVVPACKVCNYAKQGLTREEFFSLIKKIYNKHYQVDTVGSRTISTK